MPGARLDKTSNLLQTAIGVIRIGGELAGGPLYRYLGYQEASDLHANYREGTVADTAIERISIMLTKTEQV